ncbi:Ig-like domain-containing protein [Actinoplanes sp. NBC_00393]|uniref:Ig-like domain-containing protein n=1 Tax=Actinoplanes sp. NBC_00393 TaxID=2975953 RepID=UPI002E24CD27
MRLVSSLLISTLLVGSWAAPAAASAHDFEVLPGRLVVGLTTSADPARVLERLGDLALASRPVPGMSAMVVDVPPDRAEEAMRKAYGTGVRHLRSDVKLVPGGEPGPGETGTLETVRMPAAKTWATDGRGTIVGVVDTGVSPTALLPAGRILPGQDFVDGDADATDEDGHGSLVASLIAGTGETGVCAQCRILPVRAMSGRDGGTASDLAAGIVWAVKNGARVVTVTASGWTSSDVLHDAVDYARVHGVLVVGSTHLPAIATPDLSNRPREGLTVGAVDGAGRKGPGTLPSHGYWTDVAAADNLRVLGEQHLDGGVGAIAVVSGTAALAFAAKPGATAAEVREAILRTAIPSPELAEDAPILNAGRLLSEFGAADRQAPKVNSTGLAAGQVITATPVEVRPVVTDDHAVARVEVVVDGEVIAERGTPWAEPLRLSAPAGWSGDKTITIRAYDDAGNIGTGTTVVRFDTAAPAISIVSPKPAATVRNLVEVVVSAEDDVTEVTVAGVALTRQPGTSTWSGKIRVPEGRGASFTVHALDAAGNNHYTSWSGHADDSGPTATSMSPAASAKVRGTFTTKLTGVTDNVSGVAKAELWANGRYLGTGTSKQVPTGRTNGKVTLTWKLTDKVGNTRSYTRTVIADNKAPTVSITKAPGNKAKVKGTVKVSVKATDTSGIARVELIINGKVVARDTTAGYALSVNTAKQKKTMKVQVRAYDKLGNVTWTTTRTWYRK